MAFLSLRADSYFAKSLLALSWMKSQRTSKLYLCLMVFFSKSSATVVILVRISSSEFSRSYSFFWISRIPFWFSILSSYSILLIYFFLSFISSLLLFCSCSVSSLRYEYSCFSCSIKASWPLRPDPLLSGFLNNWSLSCWSFTIFLSCWSITFLSSKILSSLESSRRKILSRSFKVFSYSYRFYCKRLFSWSN